MIATILRTFKTLALAGAVASLAACGPSGKMNGNLSVSDEFKRKLFTEPDQTISPTLPEKYKTYEVYEVTDVQIGANQDASAISARVVIKSSAGSETVELVGMVRADGSASLTDIAPLADGKNRLVAEASCLDKGVCKRIIANVYFSIEGKTQKKQFASSALLSDDGQQDASLTGETKPVGGKSEADAQATLDDHEEDLHETEKDLKDETDASDTELGEFAGPTRNEALIGKLYPRSEVPEVLPPQEKEPETSAKKAPEKLPPTLPEVKPEAGAKPNAGAKAGAGSAAGSAPRATQPSRPAPTITRATKPKSSTQTQTRKQTQKQAAQPRAQKDERSTLERARDWVLSWFKSEPEAKPTPKPSSKPLVKPTPTPVQKTAPKAAPSSAPKAMTAAPNPAAKPSATKPAANKGAQNAQPTATTPVRANAPAKGAAPAATPTTASTQPNAPQSNAPAPAPQAPPKPPKPPTPIAPPKNTQDTKEPTKPQAEKEKPAAPPTEARSNYPFPPATPSPDDEEAEQKIAALEMKTAPLLNLRDGGVAEGAYSGAGRPAARIRNASLLPDSGVGLNAIRINANAHFGTGMLVSFLQNAASYLFRGLGLSLFVGDMSIRNGGRFGSSHQTHKNGLDADIAYLAIKSPLRDSALDARGNVVSGFNFEATWTFLKLAFRQDFVSDAKRVSAISRVFMSHKVKDGFCAWAKKENLLEDEKNIELLRLIRRERGHHKHFHLSLKCSPYYPSCRNLAGPPPEGPGCP